MSMTFSCIIPAYNEWPRIRQVLEVILSCDKIDEVIVINDASKDNTKEIIDSIECSHLKKIHLSKNRWKTGAIFAGIKKARWDYFIFIDSDLVGLQKWHIQSLIDPIIKKESEVTLSLRENSLPFYKWIGSDFVSGERIVPRSLFDDTEYYTSGRGFWLEVKMNEKILEANLSINNIYLAGVITPRKAYKMGYIQGTISDLKMVYDIMVTVPFWRLIRQMYRFSRFH